MAKKMGGVIHAITKNDITLLPNNISYPLCYYVHKVFSNYSESDLATTSIKMVVTHNPNLDVF